MQDEMPLSGIFAVCCVAQMLNTYMQMLSFVSKCLLIRKHFVTIAPSAFVAAADQSFRRGNIDTSELMKGVF